MARVQRRGNREIRKKKAEKPRPEPQTSTFERKSAPLPKKGDKR